MSGEELRRWLEFYRDLGVKEIYVPKGALAAASAPAPRAAEPAPARPAAPAAAARPSVPPPAAPRPAAAPPAPAPRVSDDGGWGTVAPAPSRPPAAPLRPAAPPAAAARGGDDGGWGSVAPAESPRPPAAPVRPPEDGGWGDVAPAAAAKPPAPPPPIDMPRTRPPQPPAPEPLIALPGLAPENDSFEQIRTDIGDCRRCRLCEQRNKIVFGVGNPEAKLVFVGEGPGADEDAQGIPFVGRAGQLLTQMIEGTAGKEGIPLKRDNVYICNVVKCRPPENRTPLPDEMEICGQFLFRQLSVIQPKAICALGSTAAKALLGTKDGVMRLRGNWHKWRDIPVMVTYHPSYLLRPYNQNAKREAWEDLKKVLHFVYD